MGDAAYTLADYVTRWAEVEARSAELEGPAVLDRLAMLEGLEPGMTDELLDGLGPDGCRELAFDREAWLRPKQLYVLRSAARIILFVAGRRSGKTQTASEWICDRIERGARELVIVAPTYDEAKQYMLAGHKRRVDGYSNGSGLFDLLPPTLGYEFKEDEGVVQFEGGAVLRLHSGEVPEYRGPGPDSVWGDEVIKWRYGERLLSNLRIACSSVGKVPPQILLTTSPKRLRLLRDLVMEEDVETIHGTSDENRGNVDEGWYRSEARRLGGTRQGEEELGGRLGVDSEGELFPLSAFDEHRTNHDPPDLDRIVVAIDPGGSTHVKADDTGIVAVGRAGDIHTGEAYVLADATAKYTPDGWADKAYDLAESLGASAFVVERDKYVDFVTSTLRLVGARRGYEAVVRAGSKTLIDMVHRKTGRRLQMVEILSRMRGDKATRAEPVSTMTQMGRVHMVGHLTRLETECSEWNPETSDSPNGMDAFVHAVTELFQLDRPPDEDGRATMRGMKEANARLATSDGPQRTPVDRERGRLIGGASGRGRFGGRLIG